MAFASHLSVLFDAVEDLLGHQLLEMRYRRLRAAANESPLQVLEVIANALQAHVHLLVQAMEVGLGVGVHHLLVVVLVVLRDILGTRHVPALVEVPLSARFIWNVSGWSVSELVEETIIIIARSRQPSCSFGTSLYTMSCMVRSKLMYCRGWD